MSWFREQTVKYRLVQSIFSSFLRLLSVGSALAVLCELNTHNLPRSTNQAGEKQKYKNATNPCFLPFFFSPSSILTVCMRENKGMRLA